MNGYSLLRGLRELLSETATGTWLNDRFSYDCLYDAAAATADRTSIFTNTQTITTVATQANYALNTDYLRLYLKDEWNRYFVKYYNGSSYFWIPFEEFDDIVLANQTSTASVPSRFTVKYATTNPVNVTGTAGAAPGLLVYGEAILNDTSLWTKFSTVTAGDEVHNITDGSHGVVIQKVTDIQLVTCMFDGTDDDWTVGDTYVISPQGRFEIYFDPPPSTSAHTVTLYYVQRPAPVYSPYKTYNFPIDFRDALINYAAWKYKYRDSQPNMGDAFYKYWDNIVRRYGRAINAGLNKKGFTVNLMKG